MTEQERLAIRALIDVETRRLLKLTAKAKPKAGQCQGTGYLGGRCMNTATDGEFCYAHRKVVA